MKLFCFDIDGTLIPFGGQELDQVELDALQDLLDQGHAIALASGRPFVSLKHHLSTLRGDKKFYICANGATVYDDDGNAISKTYLTADDFMHLRQYMNDDISVYAYEGQWNVVCFRHDKWTKLEQVYNLIPDENIIILDKDEPILGHHEYLKIMVSCERPVMEQFSLTKEDEENYEHSKSAPTYLELLPKGSTKGERVNDLRKYLGIDEKDVYCFGDQENDISMVSRFNGVAMENAIPSLKASAKYITKSDAEHGVTYALKHILKVI